MKNATDLSMILAGSLSIAEAISDWKNTLTCQSGDSAVKQEYIITLLADYQHSYYHIGLSISELRCDISPEFPRVQRKIASLVENVSKARHLISDLWFTRKVFIATSSCTADVNTIRANFASMGISANVYQLDGQDRLIPVGVPFAFTPADHFSKDVIEQKTKPLYSNADYTIWEHDDGSISFSLHMILANGVLRNADVYATLTELSPLREKIKAFLHTTAHKKKMTDTFASAVKDVFEGNTQAAKDTLITGLKHLQTTRMTRNAALILVSGLSLVAGAAIINGLSLFHTVPSEQVGSSIWGAFGALISLFVPNQFVKKTATYTKTAVIIETAIRMIVGAAAGVVVSLAVEANIVFGFTTGSTRAFIVPLLSMAAGWSEKFIPNFLGGIAARVRPHQDLGDSSDAIENDAP